MCWVKDALLLVGDGPQGTGLYRCRDTKGADQIDEVDAAAQVPGRHGRARAARHPARAGRLALPRHRQSRPCPGAEIAGRQLAADALADRQHGPGPGPAEHDRGRAAAAAQRRQRPRGQHPRPRRHHLAARPGRQVTSPWSPPASATNSTPPSARNGELFTFDSDMEWDEGLPWYRAVRVCHCPPGADFVWRTGAAEHARLLHRQPAADLRDRPRLAGRRGCYYDHVVPAEVPRGVVPGRLVARASSGRPT